MQVSDHPQRPALAVLGGFVFFKTGWQKSVFYKEGFFLAAFFPSKLRVPDVSR